MLSEKEMEETAAQLASFRANTSRHQATLSGLLERYTALIDDYNRLKSDYEEERDSRERYKQMAKGQDRNPFVLVLIDGDGYIFDDDMISSGAAGGQRAAHLLNQAVKGSLRNRGLENCRIMVRIYANLTGLSKALSRVKLAGPEKRSLAPFVANFNRSNELFDFVDAGELKENADYKVRAMFRLFTENPSCKHIYFAGCHDVGYISELTPYAGNRERITLVRSTNFHPEFNKLGMRTEGFPSIFRLTPLDALAQPPAKTLPISSTDTTTAGASENATICKFYLRGICTYGKACRNLHIPRTTANGTQSGPPNTGSLSQINDWRQNDTGKATGPPVLLSNLSVNDQKNFMGDKSRTPSEFYAPSSDEFSDILPHPENISPGEIPINNKQHRLDAYSTSANSEDWAAFNTRTRRHKLCNSYHLAGGCDNGSDCQYDHSPISLDLKKCLQQVALSLPCPRRGNCRLSPCIHGHICQKPDCKHRGGKTFCKIPFQAHTQDLHLAQYVPGVVRQTNVSEDNDVYAVMSGKGSPPSLPESASGVLSIDDEKQDGALLDFNDTDSVD